MASSERRHARSGRRRCRCRGSRSAGSTSIAVLHSVDRPVEVSPGTTTSSPGTCAPRRWDGSRATAGRAATASSQLAAHLGLEGLLEQGDRPRRASIGAIVRGLPRREGRSAPTSIIAPQWPPAPERSSREPGRAASRWGSRTRCSRSRTTSCSSGSARWRHSSPAAATRGDRGPDGQPGRAVAVDRDPHRHVHGHGAGAAVGGHASTSSARGPTWAGWSASRWCASWGRC